MTNQARVQHRRDGLEFTRFVAFIDGGTVVALTLLAVSVLPVSRGLSDEEWHRIFLGVLDGRNVAFVALVVAFVIVASFWLDQHLLYAHLSAIDRSFILANLVYLFLITLSPAIAVTLAEHRRDVYGGLFVVVWLVLLSAVSLGLPWLATRQDLLAHPEARPPFLRNQLRISAVRALVLVLTIVAVRYYPPWISFFVLIPSLLGLEYWRNRMTWAPV